MSLRHWVPYHGCVHADNTHSELRSLQASSAPSFLPVHLPFPGYSLSLPHIQSMASTSVIHIPVLLTLPTPCGFNFSAPMPSPYHSLPAPATLFIRFPGQCHQQSRFLLNFFFEPMLLSALAGSASVLWSRCMLQCLSGHFL